MTDARDSRSNRLPRGAARSPSSWRGYAGTGLIVLASTAAAFAMERHFDPANLTMIYLLGVVVSAMAFGRGPAVLAAVASVAVFDFVFVPPRFTFRVSDTQYLVTFAVMLVVAVVIGSLTAWLREQRELARQREQRTAALHRLTRDLAQRSSLTEVVSAAAGRIAELTSARLAIWLPAREGALEIAAGDASLVSAASDRDDVQRVFEGSVRNGHSRGDGALLHLPLEAGLLVCGVLSVETPGELGPHTDESLSLLRALASQTGLAIERCRLNAAMEEARFEAEAERARNALLSSVSHDLRTPLASITGAASSLRSDDFGLSASARHELLDTIIEEADRLDRLIGALLDMTRLEAGMPSLQRDWHSLEEVLGAVLERMRPALGERSLIVSIPAGLPLVPLDPIVFGQVIENLVGNAGKYSPLEAPIEIRAEIDAGELRFEVADRGPGFAPGEERRVFEKFYRGQVATRVPGAGLGLAICKAAVQAHGGRLEAANRPAGGASFVTYLPMEGASPPLDLTPHEASAGVES